MREGVALAPENGTIKVDRWLCEEEVTQLPALPKHIVNACMPKLSNNVVSLLVPGTILRHDNPSMPSKFASFHKACISESMLLISQKVEQ